MGKVSKNIKQVDTGTDNGTTYQNEHWDYKEGTDQDNRWYQWTTQAEEWLLNKYECNKQEGGRGLERKYVRRNFVNVLRVIGQFMNSRILVECAPRTFDAIWLKRLSKQNSPRGSLATVVAAAMAFV